MKEGLLDFKKIGLRDSLKVVNTRDIYAPWLASNQNYEVALIYEWLI